MKKGTLAAEVHVTWGCPWDMSVGIPYMHIPGGEEEEEHKDEEDEGAEE